MAERVAKEVKEKSSGRIDIQVFANSQLGTGKDMIEGVSAGALQMTTDGAGALGAFLPQLSVIEAPYLWRDAAHMAKAAGTPLFAKLNDDLVSKRGMRMLNITYYGKRHLTTGSKAVRRPPTWPASSCACRRWTPSARWPRPGAHGPRRSPSASSTWR